MTRGQRWHFLQEAKVDKVQCLSPAAHCSQPFPFAYSAPLGISAAGAYSCSVPFLALNPPRLAVRLFYYIPACYLFAFGLFDLPAAEVQVAFYARNNRVSARARDSYALAENGFHVITP
jgi:hypothetical protein